MSDFAGGRNFSPINPTGPRHNRKQDDGKL